MSNLGRSLPGADRGSLPLLREMCRFLIQGCHLHFHQERGCWPSGTHLQEPDLLAACCTASRACAQLSQEDSPFFEIPTLPSGAVPGCPKEPCKRAGLTYGHPKCNEKFYVSKMYFYSTAANLICHEPSLVVLYKHRQTLAQAWAAHSARSVGSDTWTRRSSGPSCQRLEMNNFSSWSQKAVTQQPHIRAVWFLLCLATGLG